MSGKDNQHKDHLKDRNNFDADGEKIQSCDVSPVKMDATLQDSGDKKQTVKATSSMTLAGVSQATSAQKTATTTAMNA